MSVSPDEMLKDILNNPEAMEQINTFMASVGKDGQKENTDIGISPEMLAQASKMMKQMSADDDKGVKLILALKPYLSEERQSRADTAVKFLKLSKLSTMIGDFQL